MSRKTGYLNFRGRRRTVPQTARCAAPAAKSARGELHGSAISQAGNSTTRQGARGVPELSASDRTRWRRISRKAGESEMGEGETGAVYVVMKPPCSISRTNSDRSI